MTTVGGGFKKKVWVRPSEVNRDARGREEWVDQRGDGESRDLNVVEVVERAAFLPVFSDR